MPSAAVASGDDATSEKARTQRTTTTTPPLAPRSARYSLKRARLLFDVPPAGPSSPSPADRAASAAMSSFVPPSYDRDAASHRTSVHRRMKLTYPGEVVDGLAFRSWDDREGGGGGGGSRESATSRAVREIGEAASERIRSGGGVVTGGGEGRLVIHRGPTTTTTAAKTAVGGGAVVATGGGGPSSPAPPAAARRAVGGGGILVPREGGGPSTTVPAPRWHAPWKLSTVISSHLGWVRSVAFDPTNALFATGGADRVIKIFDLAKACVASDDALRITLTGHISPVRGLAFSERHPYLFSGGEDKLVKCWDLETNQVIRHYHGHLSGVFALELHPTLDLLVTGGRDAVARVWDMRTKHQVHCLTGHDNTVGAILTKGTDPQIITGSYDSTIKLWDLAAGKCMTTLTHHKKSVRALAQPSYENTFLSGAADTLKKWVGTDGRFVKNFTGHGAVINALAINDDGVAMSGADDGTMNFWDYGTGHCFQTSATVAQPGSLDAENGIFAAKFDLTGTRLVTCEADKTIKIWREDERASEVSHPIDMARWRKKCIAESKRRY